MDKVKLITILCNNHNANMRKKNFRELFGADNSSFSRSGLMLIDSDELFKELQSKEVQILDF